MRESYEAKLQGPPSNDPRSPLVRRVSRGSFIVFKDIINVLHVESSDENLSAVMLPLTNAKIRGNVRFASTLRASHAGNMMHSCAHSRTHERCKTPKADMTTRIQSEERSQGYWRSSWLCQCSGLKKPGRLASYQPKNGTFRVVSLKYLRRLPSRVMLGL